MDKKTLIHDEQLKLGAKMVQFAGWEMPVQFSGIIDEHNTVRNALGLFDVSHMGEFFVSGKDSLNFLESLVPQQVSNLVDGKAVYCQLLNDNGGCVDDLIIYKLSDLNYLLIVNASGVTVDFDWISAHKGNYDVKLENKSDDYSLLALQGPKASDLIADLGIKKEEQPLTFFIKPAKLFGVDILLSRTGYTGEDGLEIMMKNEHAVMFWNSLLKEGAKYGIKPIGLGARDTLRLEAAMPLYGNDLSNDISPVEAGLSWSIAKDKKENYTAKDIILSQLKNGTAKKLIGLVMTERAIARHEYEIYYNDKKIGFVSSGCYSPTLGKNIAMGYIDTSFGLKTGDSVKVMVRNKLYSAEIVKRPFIVKRNKV